MADWAVPDIFGTVDEFSEVYVRRIADGHRVSRSPQNLHEGRRAAWLLWNRMMPLTVPVNLSPELPTVTRYAVVAVHLDPIQAKCYVEAGKIVHDAVRQGHLDPFIGAHVLQVTASHSFALVKGVLTSLDGMSFRIKERLPIFEQIEKARNVFQKISAKATAILDQRTDRQDRYPSSKLRVVCKLLDVCLARGERMVVFTSSPEVQKGMYAGLKEYLKTSEHDLVFIYDPSGYVTKNPPDELARWGSSRSGSVIVAPVGNMSECVEESGWSFRRASRIVLVDCCWNSVDNLQGLMRSLPSSTRDAPPLHVYSLVAAATCERVWAGATSHSYPDPGPPNFLVNREIGPEVYRPITTNSTWDYDDRPMTKTKITAERSSPKDVLRMDDEEGGALAQLSALRFALGGGHVVYEIDIPAPGKLSSAAYMLTRSLHAVSPEDVSLAQNECVSAMSSYKALWNGLEKKSDRTSIMNGPVYADMLDRQTSILPAIVEDLELALQCNLFWSMRTHFDLFSRMYARDFDRQVKSKAEPRQSLPANGSSEAPWHPSATRNRHGDKDDRTAGPKAPPSARPGANGYVSGSR
jgi:hypothetical protein